MPVNHFTEFLSLVASAVHPHTIPLPGWMIAEETPRSPVAPARGGRGWKPYTVTTRWGGEDRTAWFRRTVTVPREFRGRPVVLLAHLNEALLYVDGRVHQGIDRNRKEALLTPRARGGERFELRIQAYAGRSGATAEFCSAYLAVMNPKARELHTALRTLEAVLRDVRMERTEAERIKDLLHRTLLEFENARPGSPQVPAAIDRAHDFLFETIRREFSGEQSGSVRLLPHSHIDVVWLWTLKETARKCARTFSTALRMMEEFPEFRFMQSQAFLYDLTRRQYPEIYRAVRRQVRAGRWEATGATWVEPDCNIPNGESLVRQVLYGRRFFRKEFGVEADVLWLPDTFGYSWALPQILKKSGVRAFFTTKLLWNDTNPFPHNSFVWEGIDGSRIPAHEPPVGLEGMVSPAHLFRGWDEFREKETGGEVLQTFGYGDGGGGPTREHLEALRVLGSFSGMPCSAVGGVRAFADRLVERAHSLPVWSGELYLEMHRGTYTTQAWVKRENRRAEAALYTSELLASAAFLRGGPGARYPAAELESAWKRLLLNQFHDIVPGTAIADAYEEVRNDFADLQSACEAVNARALRSLVRPPLKSRGNRFAVFNPLGWERDEQVVLTIPGRHADVAVRNGGGELLPHQVLRRGRSATTVLCRVSSLPPFGFAALTAEPAAAGAPQESPFAASGGAVRTPLYDLTFAPDGSIASLKDLRRGVDVFLEGQPGNAFQIFRDRPKQWEAWEIDPEYEKNPLDILRFQSRASVESGPLRLVLRSRWSVGSRSSILQDLVLYRDSPRIDFVTVVHWHEAQTLLKAAFPIAVPASSVTYEIQFGALERSSRPAGPWDAAKFEVPGQQWADVSAVGSGVSLLNDCKYGYDAADSRLRLTLIRSPHYPHPVEPWWLHDEAVTDQGEHRFTYALFPHAGDWRSAETVRRARELNVPPLVVRGAPRTGESLIDISSPAVLVDAVKRAEGSGSLIVRLHEAHGSAAECDVRAGFPLRGAAECDLEERRTADLPLRGRTVRLSFSPFEIKTLELIPSTQRS
jgi:alpha-mannosidase